MKTSPATVVRAVHPKYKRNSLTLSTLVRMVHAADARVKIKLVKA